MTITPDYVDNPDNPAWLVRFGEGLRAVCNTDPLIAATCPFCGQQPTAHNPKDHRSDRVRIVESIECYRPVVFRGGRVIGDDGYHTGEGYDDGVHGSQRFECCNPIALVDGGRRVYCGERWVIPRWLWDDIRWDSIGRTRILEGG